MERGRYNGYRGRSGVQKVLLGLVSALAVLVVLVLLLLLFGQRYLYYTADGVRLDLPFLTHRPAPPPDVSQVVVEVLPPAPKPADPTEQEIAGEPNEEAALPDRPVGDEGRIE
ncbi:MAG: hypothetical protein IJB75_04980 [Oscillospiraceae bacterium]|nr:hypothetical protein [Oscillospiraceae bacterium]